MIDSRIKTGVVYTKSDGFWWVEVEGWHYVITDQKPFHPVLRQGLHENRRVIVKIIGLGYAKFLEFAKS